MPVPTLHTVGSEPVEEKEIKISDLDWRKSPQHEAKLASSHLPTQSQARSMRQAASSSPTPGIVTPVTEEEEENAHRSQNRKQMQAMWEQQP